MKELSIEQKAKAYDEALEKAKEFKNNPFAGYDGTDLISALFPELIESEDERIRNFLIKQANSVLESITDDDEEVPAWKSALAWLEKQGEQKPTDKVEPKFKKGDWIVFNGLTLYVKEVVKGFYRTVSKGGIPNSYDWDIDNVARLWTIQDAKEGDVLVDEDANVIGIFEGIEGMCWHSKFYYSNITKEFYGIECGGSHLKEFAKPANKEQRNTLFKAMADAGYTFDFKKKELKKIEQKHAEWSEEDEKVIHCLEYTVRHFYEDEDTVRWCCDWLKSLRPQNTWKPSDEQMNVLLSEVTAWKKGCPKQVVLESLYNDLKKLKDKK